MQVSVHGLYEAVQARGSQGERRGFLRLSAHPRLESVLFTLDLQGGRAPRMFPDKVVMSCWHRAFAAACRARLCGEVSKCHSSGCGMLCR